MKYKILTFIFLIGLIASILLTMNQSTGICDPGKGCDVVNGSSYGSTLGIKNSVFGIFIFAFILGISLLHLRRPNQHTRRIIHLAVILGSIVAIYLLYLQLFVIKAFCEYCLIIDISMVIGLIFLLSLWDH